MGRLDGKVALITGTAGGQGRAAARLFAREGAIVVGCDVKVDDNRETRRLVESEGGRMIGREPVDLSVAEQASDFVETAVSEGGGLDIVYNNASAQRFSPFGEMTDDDWAFTMKNDLELVYLVTRYAWKHLIDRGGGSIINTASGAALLATRSFPTAAHATAKSGVLGLTRALAGEGAQHNIRANSICPGQIETPVLAEHMTTDTVAEMERAIPLGRMGQPDDIAYYALYLASDESAFVTGSNLVIDGGTTTILP